MHIYHAHGRDYNNESFSFVVRAESESNARMLVRDVLSADPVIFYCSVVGLPLKGETDESIIW